MTENAPDPTNEADGNGGADAAETSGTEGGPQPEARGMKVLASSEFSLDASIGGVRGLIEALAPGLVFVVVYVLTRDLTVTLVAALAVSFVAVVARLVQRTPLTQALSGIFGVAIGVLWAWRTGEAKDFFALGLWTNGVYLVGCLISILIRWPVIGLIVELLKGGVGQSAAGADGAAGVGRMMTSWRSDGALLRRYAAATWLWVALFGVRLAVQLPLYLGTGDSVGWLGTARLVMGVPLWALTLWLTWVLVRQPGAAQARPHPHPVP